MKMDSMVMARKKEEMEKRRDSVIGKHNFC
jgi:hypothetical protein